MPTLRWIRCWNYLTRITEQQSQKCFHSNLKTLETHEKKSRKSEMRDIKWCQGEILELKEKKRSNDWDLKITGWARRWIGDNKGRELWTLKRSIESKKDQPEPKRENRMEKKKTSKKTDSWSVEGSNTLVIGVWEREDRKVRLKEDLKKWWLIIPLIWQKVSTYRFKKLSES